MHTAKCRTDAQNTKQKQQYKSAKLKTNLKRLMLIANQRKVLNEDLFLKFLISPFPNPEKVKCDECEEKEAHVCCLTCKFNFCDECNKKAHSLKTTQKHERTTIQSQSLLCQCFKHQKPFELFCNTCQSPMCVRCCVSDHKVSFSFLHFIFTHCSES